MSPRAACRLERLGYTAVYDYVAGKMDWLSFGLPYEGSAVLAGDLARRDVPTCGPTEQLHTLHARLQQAPFCVVVNDEQVVLGVVWDAALREEQARTPEEVMDYRVTAVRPAEEVGPLLARMDRAKVEAILVTRSDGTLYGLFVADDARTAGPEAS